MKVDMSGKGKDLYLNGELIGRYNSTGDYGADAKQIQEILREKGLDRTISRPIQMFYQALSFCENGRISLRSRSEILPTNPLSIAPFVVNSTFAIELYLKALAGCYQKKLWGHDLLSLYDELPTEAAALIERRISMLQSSAHFFSSVNQLRDALAKAASAFVEWRYLDKDSAGPIEIAGQIEIGRVLHEAFQDAVSSTSPNPETTAAGLRDVFLKK